MKPFRTLMSLPGLPWRVQNKLEKWVEGQLREIHPALYRWLHFGNAADRVRPLTYGPKHHFFGYYEKSPWNASQTLLLAHEASFNDRAPAADDRLTIGIVDTQDNNRFRALAETSAWNWQQGAMLQWHPTDPEKTFIHNDRRNDAHVGVVRDISGKETMQYSRAIYAVLPCGKTGLSVNFARLAVHRPGYGYAGSHDPFHSDPHPAQDGIWNVNLETGDSMLVVSLDKLARIDPKPSMKVGVHYINHIQPSRNGKWIAFFHIWTIDSKNWEVRLYICRADGSELRYLLDTGKVSHYDWWEDEAILVWAAHPATGKPHFLLVALDGTFKIVGGDSLVEDGHCSFSPDKRWVLNDTYPDRFDMRTLMLVKWPEERRIDIARLYSPRSKWWGEIRCDLHPRWSHDGKMLCIDSVHEGTRQMYAVDISEWIS